MASNKLWMALAALIAAGMTTGCGGKAEPEAEKPASGITSMRVDDSEEITRPEEPLPPPPTEEEKVAEAVADYESTLAADLDNPENADTMLALANLYRQKYQDYAKAAQWYQEYINQHASAENPRAAMAFSQLLFCYRQLGAEENVRAVCRQMMSVFPPESDNYRYAEGLLSGAIEE